MSKVNTETSENISVGTSIIEALREYFNNCELFDNAPIGIDGVPKKMKAFSIGTMPVDEVLKKYMGGSSLRQYVFELVATYPEADTEEQNAQNAAFFEEFANWLSEKTKANNLPHLPTGCTAKSMEAMSSGYFQGDDNNARIYVMQCRVVYFKKR